MSYIRNNLMGNENIIFTAKVSPAVFLTSIFSCIVTLVPFGISAFLLPKASTITTGSAPPPLPQTMNPEKFFASIFMSISCIVGIALIIVTIVLVLDAIITMLTTEFVVTNRRVFAKTGFIRRHILEVFLQKVESVRVYQSILGRLFDFGVVTVTGTGGTRESFRAISNPLNVRNKINQVIEKQNQQPQVSQ